MYLTLEQSCTDFQSYKSTKGPSPLYHSVTLYYSLVILSYKLVYTLLVLPNTYQVNKHYKPKGTHSLHFI